MSAWLALPWDPQQDEPPLAKDQRSPCLWVQIPGDPPQSQVHPCGLSKPSRWVPSLLPSATELPLRGAPSRQQQGCAGTAAEGEERLQRTVKKKKILKNGDYAKINREKQSLSCQLRHGGREQMPSAHASATGINAA